VPLGVRIVVGTEFRTVFREAILAERCRTRRIL
jgi:hypothetical protein